MTAPYEELTGFGEGSAAYQSRGGWRGDLSAGPAGSVLPRADRLVPASPAVPAATENNQHDDEDNQKCRRVHCYLLKRAASLRSAFDIATLRDKGAPRAGFNAYFFFSASD
jgi:hypothetical protein